MDARRTAGIGRYVSSLTAALADVDGLELRTAAPRRTPARESWVLRFLNAQPAVLSAAWRWHPTLVHAPASDPVLGWPLHRQVVTVHDVIPWTTWKRRRPTVSGSYFGFQRRRFRACAAIIAVSDSVRDDAIDVFKLSPARVHVVPEGVSDAFAATPGVDDAGLRTAAGVPSQTYLMWVGSMRAHDPRKAIDSLLDAVASIDTGAVSLLMVGETGPESERVGRRARELGVRVVFTGYVTDETLAALYRGAAAVMLTSLYEGFGLPALEALASGAPLVATRGGNLPQLVGDAALLVPAGDSGELSRALATIIGDPTLQSSLRARGPVAAQAFTWRRAAELTASVYLEAAGAAAGFSR